MNFPNFLPRGAHTFPFDMRAKLRHILMLRVIEKSRMMGAAFGINAKVHLSVGRIAPIIRSAAFTF